MTYRTKIRYTATVHSATHVQTYVFDLPDAPRRSAVKEIEEATQIAESRFVGRAERIELTRMVVREMVL